MNQGSIKIYEYISLSLSLSFNSKRSFSATILVKESCLEPLPLFPTQLSGINHYSFVI